MKIKSPFLIVFCALIIIIASALISIPKENWNKLFSNKHSNLATVFDGTSESLGICTNGEINSSVMYDSTLYYGGTFTTVGDCTGGGVPINTSTGIALSTYQKILGSISSTISDGNGGWYIGGSFSYVGDQPRANIAHILSDGTVDLNFNPGTDGNVVYTMAISENNILYIGGSFQAVGGITNNKIAAYDLTNNVMTNFDLGLAITNQVTSLLISSSTLYIGGSFTTIGGLPRNNLAAYDLINSTITSFDPNITIGGGSIKSLAISSSTLYIGGAGISAIGGVARSNLAAYDLINATTTSFNPSPDSSITSLLISDNTLYIGGYFSNIGGQPRNRLAAYDLINNTITSLNPNITSSGVSSQVDTLAILGSNLYIGGHFSNVGGLVRNRFAVYDLINSTTTSLIMNIEGINNNILSMAISGSNLYVGGSFKTYGGLARSRIAAFDLINATTTSFNPSILGSADGDTAYVSTMVISDSILYVGGVFARFAGINRNRIAAYDLINATTTSFNPGAFANSVSALAVSENILYVGGLFTTFGGLARSNLAAYDILNATTTNFNPGVGNQVLALAVSSSTLYVGGNWSTFGGQTRNKLAAYDLINATTTSFNPNISGGRVYALMVASSTLYVGGDFTSFYGLTRTGLASYDIVNATTTSLSPIIDVPLFGLRAVKTLVMSGTELYVGGSFTIFGDQSRKGLASYSITGATTTSFNPNIGSGGTVNTIAISDSNIYAGGTFTSFSTALLGSIVSVKALSLLPVTVYDVSSKVATLKADIIRTGSSPITERGFRYGVSTDYAYNSKETSSQYASNKNNVAAVYSEAGNFTTGEYLATVVNLTPSTTYHYQAYITDSLGTTYSDDATFTTLAVDNRGGVEAVPVNSTPVSSGGTTGVSVTSIATSSISTATSTITATSTTTKAILFNKNLFLGISHPDVKKLQQYLNSKGYKISLKGAGSKGYESEYFGWLTQKALIKFQKDNKITPSVGYFGPKTRGFINKI